MKRHIWLRSAAGLLLVLLLVLTLSVAVSAQENVTDRVYDLEGLLTPGEAETLTAHMDTLSEEHGVQFYLATYRADDVYDDFVGDDYCYEVNDIDHVTSVLLIITYDESDGKYYYDLYTYGRADRAIKNGELSYILDDPAVFDNIKSGQLSAGASAFFDRSAEAYSERVDDSLGVIIGVSGVLSLLIACGVCYGVVTSYKRKQASVDYPLDRYAKLNLTRESDTFAGSAVTRTYVPRNNGGGRSGGSSHGGGGGHRGGR